MTYIISTVLVLGVIQFILYKIILRNRDSMALTNEFRAYVLSTVIVVVIGVICLFLFGDAHFLIGILLTVLFGVRAAFERLYLRSTKRHIVSLSMVAASLVTTMILVLMMMP
ncbi:hypothetical protein DCC85_05355 [Paenibacillus sp. CAA11]|uniref:DUF4181 domain-containing protein n=1 Tax=Paenibacillus sp. CAA11 TaxID=1532905 RepID=UPI000D381B7C|nr:DUF4181 domain-containing protein [Paenibacillus sp. CAA11]AWB43701.1 hypothetical protein DCC85_05355 [Paenibacillus sp. CAA11]